MSFEPIDPGGGALGKPGVRIRRGPKSQVILAFGPNMPMTAGAKYQLAIGAGDDAGRLLVAAANGLAGYSASREMNGASHLLSISARKLGVSVKRSTDLPYEITDAGIVIDLRPVLTPTPEGRGS